MKIIVVEFLSPDEYEKDVYKVAAPYISKLHTIKCSTSADVLHVLHELNTNNEPLIITFLSHGNQIRLGKIEDGIHHQLPFDELLPVLNECRTNHPLFVNLMANCHSHGMKDFLQLAKKIDEFWVVTDETRSILKAILAAIDKGDSDAFLELNDQGTDCLYIKYIDGQEVRECETTPPGF